MAFATSSSAFGMKPANTSIFGQQQQQPATTSFAGAAPPGQNQPQQGSTFGAFGQQQNQQQPTTNIFGQPQQQQPAASTGLFGQPQPQQQQTTGTTSLFGQPQQQQQSTGLFGQPQQQQQATGTTNLFGQPQQQQTTGTTGLFGQPQQQQTTGTTGLFGQPQQQQQNTGITNLFGQPQQQQQNTTTTGGLFGQQQPQQQQQQQANAFGGSLFGTTSNTNNNQQQQQQQPAQSNPFGGLFGGNNNNQQQQPQQQSNLFGGSTTNSLQTQPTLGASAFGSGSTTGGGLFGGGNGLFGAKPQQPQQSTLGTQTPGTFGNAVAQPGNNALQFPNGVPPFTKSTKFNDLPDDYKKLMENIDSFIQGRVQICKDLQQRKLGDEPIKGHDAIRQLNKELINTATTIRNDLHLTNDLKSKVDQAVEDTIVATRIIDGFRNPQSGNTYLKDHAAFPLEYFTRVTEQMKERLAWYQSTIEQIERKLASASSTTQTPQSISATLQAQHQIFLALANKTAAVDTELQKIRTLYTQLWRSKTGSVRDPFNDVVKSSTSETAGDFGLGSLNFR